MSTETIAPPRPRADVSGSRHADPPAHRTQPPRTASGRRTPSTPVELRHPWASRAWPSTAAEELTFVEALRERASIAPDPTGDAGFERRDVTAMVTALRSGLTAGQLLSAAPGLRAGRLLAAHTTLDALRLESETAWRTIAAEATAEALAENRILASALLPALIDQIVREAQRTGDVERVIRRASAHVDRTTATVIALEQRLVSADPGSEVALEIGELLYDSRSTAAWDLETFLPPRVGTLVPIRIASLLSEARSTGRARRC